MTGYRFDSGNITTTCQELQQEDEGSIVGKQGFRIAWKIALSQGSACVFYWQGAMERSFGKNSVKETK